MKYGMCVMDQYRTQINTIFFATLQFLGWLSHSFECHERPQEISQVPFPEFLIRSEVTLQEEGKRVRDILLPKSINPLIPGIPDD